MAYLGPPPSQKLATPTSQYFSGNGSTTAFTLNRPVNVAEDLNVFVNNVPQEPGSGKSYTATGTTLTFDAAPASGTNNVYVVYRGLAEPTTRLEHPSNQPLAATTGTFSGNVSTTPGSISIKAINGGYTGGLLIEDDSNTTKSAITHVVGTMAISANASADHMLITADGEVTKPLQPAFQVNNSSTQSNIPINTGTTIVFDQEVIDKGGNFASNTFTASVTGSYFIGLKVNLQTVDSAADYYRLRITTSNRNYDFFIDPDFGQDPALWTLSMTMVCDMDASDTSQGNFYQAGGTAQTDLRASECQFYGFLIA